MSDPFAMSQEVAEVDGLAQHLLNIEAAAGITAVSEPSSPKAVSALTIEQVAIVVLRNARMAAADAVVVRVPPPCPPAPPHHLAILGLVGSTRVAKPGKARMVLLLRTPCKVRHCHALDRLLLQQIVDAPDHKDEATVLDKACSGAPTIASITTDMSGLLKRRADAPPPGASARGVSKKVQPVSSAAAPIVSALREGRTRSLAQPRLPRAKAGRVPSF